MNSSEDYIANFNGRICRSMMFPQHLSLRCSEAVVNELTSELKIAETTFDVVIHVVDMTRRAVEKFNWRYQTTRNVETR